MEKRRRKGRERGMEDGCEWKGKYLGDFHDWLVRLEELYQ